MRWLLLLFTLVAAPLDATPRFSDAAAALGLDFEYQSGASTERYYPEIFGAGVALIDYDRDGDLDVYLVQGGDLVTDAPRPSDRLYRQDRVAGAPRFVDVTARSGIDARGYGMGVAVGDYDGDGHADLYVTNVGGNQLWRNQGDGTFEDTTAVSGTDDSRWSVPALFFDADGDGDQDLYIGNYVDFAPATNRRCFGESGAPDYCKPQVYPALPDRLLRNRGPDADGRVTFEDATVAFGLGAARGPALGAISDDFDGDGRADLYIANDGTENQLWMAQADGTFVDDAVLAGAALSGEGQPEGSMGVDARDLDGNGTPDLFMTHLVRETHTLYLNDGHGLFRDATREYGLAATTFPYTGFGTAWLDVDNDGRLDLVLANGAVQAVEGQRRAKDPFPYREPNQLLLQSTDGRYRDHSDGAGAAFAHREVSRGLAVGDIDDDGDPDVVITNNDGPVRLLRNDTAPRGRSLTVQVLDADGGTADGARLMVNAGRWHRVRTGGSYASASDPRALVGLAARERPGDLIVEWPDGSRRRVIGLPADVQVVVRR